MPDARLTLQPEPASVGVARASFREHDCPRQDAEQVEVAELLVSELVTNAIRHGAPPVTLELACDDDHVLNARVRDAGHALPQARSVAVDTDHGRGLAITAVLSDAWGVDPGPDGKSVWFRLRRGGARSEHSTRPASDVPEP